MGMKKLSAMFISTMLIFSLSVSAFASNTEKAAETGKEKEAIAYTITVSDEILNLSDIPVAPYEENGTLMVPLRKIGEALGYKINYNPETKAITVEDEYIQKAILFNKINNVEFEGKLNIIDMSRTVENAVATVIYDGYTYVPLEFFEEFLNDITTDGTSVTISPSKAEINN